MRESEEEPIPVAVIETSTKPARSAPPNCFVIHTTGDTDGEAVHRYYSRGGISPHAMIDLDGVIFEYVPTDRIAYHCGYKSDSVPALRYKDGTWRRYVRGKGDVYTKQDQDYSGYETWDARWGFSARSPQDLITGARPNARSIGIECLASHHIPPECFTDAQYESLAAYLRTQAARYGIPLNRQHVLGHYDVNPLARCNRNGDTDPGGNFNWQRLIALCNP